MLCSACLNLAITFSCEIPEVRNYTGTIQTVNNFFGYPNRQRILQMSIEKMLDLKFDMTIDLPK